METSAGLKHKKSLKIVFFITASYLIVEVIVGFLSNSLALLSDAAHMFTDVGGQALALFAIWMSSKPRNNYKTFGYYRVEIFSALINAVVLILISGYILYEAWERFQDPPQVAGYSMLIVSSVGLVINLISMRLLRAGSEESINIKGAFLEVVSDMLSSVAVIVAGIVIIFTGWLYIDPIMSAFIGLFILPRTYKLLKETVNIMLEAVPDDVDVAEVEKCISDQPEIKSFHDLHVWTITSGLYAMSVHVIMNEEADFNKVDEAISNLKLKLASKFKIGHTTFEVHTEKKDYNANII